MATIGTPHVLDWLKAHPAMHRTVHQGQMIVCPHQVADGYHLSRLVHRPSTTARCPLCPDHLGKATLIKGEKGEFAWPTAA